MKHKFSIFYSHLNQKDFNLEIKDKDLINRITKILRLEVGEEVTLFNKNFFADFKIVDVAKRAAVRPDRAERVEGYERNSTKDLILLETKKIELVKENIIKINLNIGLLKKESFEEVLYSATELGVSKIQPIISEKIHKEWDFKNYKERFQKIIIAAAEQSKNYNFPDLKEPINFVDYPFASHTNIFFDIDGQNILKIYEQIKNSSEINLIIGPEADFSEKEKEIIKNSGTLICKLTPTVLRSVQAANISAGAIISLFNN